MRLAGRVFDGGKEDRGGRFGVEDEAGGDRPFCEVSKVSLAALNGRRGGFETVEG